MEDLEISDLIKEIECGCMGMIVVPVATTMTLLGKMI